MSIRAKLFGTALLALSCAAVVSAPSSALASNPAANYAVPTKLEFFPDESKATSVVIHGAFFFYQNGGSYGTPSCGYMYFSCPAGSETMCRMQWTDIKNAIGQPQCVGFGPQNMVRATSTPSGWWPTSCSRAHGRSTREPRWPRCCRTSARPRRRCRRMSPRTSARRSCRRGSGCTAGRHRVPGRARWAGCAVAHATRAPGD